MSWSASFRRALMADKPRRHLVQSFPTPVKLGGGQTGEWSVRSYGRGAAAIDADRYGATSGAEVRVGEWTSTIGQWSVQIVGDPRAIRARMWRGQLVVHKIGFPGWPEHMFETVQVGVLWDMRGTPGRWTLVMRDATTAMMSRYEASAAKWALFHSVGNSTALNGGYTAADDPVTVDATASLEREDSGTGLVVLDPDGERRNYVTYTGTTSTTLTGTTGGALGTTDQSAADNATVKDVAYIAAHPIDAFRKIWASTGTASANGAYDTLPAGWGYGLDDSLLDHADMNWFVRFVKPDSGDTTWTFASDGGQDNGLAWLSERFAQGGFWITTRQGRLTVRGALDPYNTNADALDGDIVRTGVLSSEWLTGEVQWSAWEGLYGLEARELWVTTASSTDLSSTETVKSHPAVEYRELDLSSLIFANESKWQDLIRRRLGPWVLRLNERIELNTTHPLAPGLAPGDLVNLHIPWFGGRHELSTIGFAGRAGMVTAVHPDWWRGGATRVVLAVPPPRAGVLN